MASIRDVLGYYRPYWRPAVLSIAGVCFFELLDLTVPYATGQLLSVLSGQPVDAPVQAIADWLAAHLRRPVDKTLVLAVLLGAMCLATVIRAPIQPWVGHWFHWHIALRARRDFLGISLKKLLSLPLDFYDENNPGRISGLVARGIANQSWSYPDIAGRLIPKCCRVLGVFVVIACIDRGLAAVLAVSFVAILALTMTRLRRQMRVEERLERYNERTESRTSEIITNIKTIKAFGAEQTELQRQLRRFEREFKVHDYRLHLGYVALNTLRSTLVQVCLFANLAFALWQAQAGHISLAHFVTVITIASMAFAEVGPIGEVTEVFARRYASMARFHSFLQEPEGADAAALTTPAASRRFAGEVRFERLSFGYDAARPVLQNIDLTIRPYQTVALVGRSGAGKSTLVKLLFRYFEPTAGAITIDGQDIRDLDIGAYRRRLAIVHQEVDVFNGTLLDNLTYGNPQATPEQIAQACRIARVDDFVCKLPAGYQTIVGERGVRLSGGQRQRLGIARALIADPDVLVFDEATSSLDYESERAIQQAMADVLGTRTTIIIAHRLSTVREADCIVVLDGGRVAQIGTHRELVAQPGLYRRLHELSEQGELVS